MEKIKYEFDPYNRLTATNSSLRGMRQVIDGQFKTSGNNALFYSIKSPLPGYLKSSHQIKLKGTWSLTKEHQLRLALEKSARQSFGEEIILQGEIIDARENALVFAINSRTKDGKLSVYSLTLNGVWATDEYNRISFRIEKEDGDSDILLFEGAWKVNGNYQIVYSFRKENLIRKSKQLHALIFKGQWQIGDKTRLSYSLEANSLSRFEFCASAGIFKDKYIKYELGLTLAARKNPVKRTITFNGKWKLKKNVGLVFEIERQGSKTKSFVFGAQARLVRNSAVSFSLRNSSDKPIGAQLELSREIFSGDGQAFLRLLQLRQESAIVAGVGWRW